MLDGHGSSFAQISQFNKVRCPCSYHTLPTYLKIACAKIACAFLIKLLTLLPIRIDASNTDPTGTAVFSFGRGAMHPSLSGCRHSLGLCVCVAGSRWSGVCADGHSE